MWIDPPAGPTLDPNALVQMVQAGAWTPLTAIVVYVAVTFVKDDARLPAWLTWLRMPPPARPFVATALGLLGAIALAVSTGTPPLNAFAQAFAGVLAAILFHHGVVEGARDGRELPFPWLRPPPPAPVLPANDHDAPLSTPPGPPPPAA